MKKEEKMSRTIRNIFKENTTSRSDQIFHGGAIVLISLIAGIIFFQFVAPPPDIAPENIQKFRLILGTFLGTILACIGTTLYLIWSLKRARKAQKIAYQAIDDETKKQLEKIKS